MDRLRQSGFMESCVWMCLHRLTFFLNGLAFCCPGRNFTSSLHLCVVSWVKFWKASLFQFQRAAVWTGLKLSATETRTWRYVSLPWSLLQQECGHFSFIYSINLNIMGFYLLIFCHIINQQLSVTKCPRDQLSYDQLSLWPIVNVTKVHWELLTNPMTRSPRSVMDKVSFA